MLGRSSGDQIRVPSMSVDPAEERKEGHENDGAKRKAHSHRRLQPRPAPGHEPERYDDVRSEFDPALFSSLECYLPVDMLGEPLDVKVQFMREVLGRYLPEGERSRVQKHKEYRKKILSAYQPFHKELYEMHPDLFFDPSFIKAVNSNSEDSFKQILMEQSPGVYMFSMLQPSFCEMLLAEVENFEKWVSSANFKILRPNTMNNYGAVLDDFGLEPMLNTLMNDFICPLSKVLFPEVGGSSLDSHHGFVVEYGEDRDTELGFHVDDSEVTLNVCLGKQFSGGELFFRGIRCDKHVNSETQPEEIFDYCHAPGKAVLHRGRHRHGARATISGHRVNLLLWCRSSVFREMKKHRKNFSSWCAECQREKHHRWCQSVAATKLAFIRSGASMV